MRSYKAFFLLFLMSVFSFTFFVGCSEDDDVNEYKVLLKYLEETDFINRYAPAIRSASAVQTDLTSGTQYVIDIRSLDKFNEGHVPGAVNVAWADILSHVEGITSNPTSIVLVCYTGQSAAYAASLLRLLGHDNVYSMAFGMSSWNSDFDSWSAKLSSQYANDFETTMNAKGDAVKAPKLNTGEDEAEAILRARVEDIFEDGFGAGAIDASTVVPNSDNYYVINYWPETNYTGWGHIPGAYQYTPKEDLKSSVDLDKVPADQTVVVYCFTGQTSAYVTAYLKVLGYDAKSLKFGANTMIYDTMDSHKFSDGSIMGYTVETTP